MPFPITRPMTRTLAAAALALAAGLTATAGPAAAGLTGGDYETRSTDKPVAQVMDALEKAVNEAGATVFARVDHTKGAEEVGLGMHEAQLLIFGNPKLGTPAMNADPLAGLVLPLRVLVYRDPVSDETKVVYEEVDEMFDDLKIDDDAEYVKKMEEALEKLTEKAVE